MTSLILQVEDLRTAPARNTTGPVSVLSGIGFELRAREHVAVVSDDGAASALLRAVTLIHRPAAGRVLFEGRDLTRLTDARLRPVRRHLQYTGGHPARALWLGDTVERAVREPLHIHRLGTPRDQQAQVEAALRHFGLNPWLYSRRVSLLSSALRQQVMLARALVLQPRLLVTDEVVDHLEPATAEPVLERLIDRCRLQGATWLWSTRRLDLARRFADRILVLADGRLGSVISHQ